MSDPYYLLISFSCPDNDHVAEIAQRLLPTLIPHAALAPEAIWYLEDLAQRSGPNLGSKGGMSVWGIVTTKLYPAAFVEVITPFCAEVLDQIDHMLIMYQRQAENASYVYEIRWQLCTLIGEALDPPVLVTQHHGPYPFTWFPREWPITPIQNDDHNPKGTATT